MRTERTPRAIAAALLTLALALAPTASADAASPPNTVAIKIKRWNIAKSVTVSQDLERMAATVGISTSRTRDKVHTRRWGSYYAGQLWRGNGVSDVLGVKIGTAALASAAPANMALELTPWLEELNRKPGSSAPNKDRITNSTRRITVFFFKGSRKAVVYGQYVMTAVKKGKTIKTKGGEKVRLAVPRSFKRGQKYRATGDPVFWARKVSPGEGLAKRANVYYKDGIYPISLDLSFPAVTRSVKVRVKNVRQSLSSKVDKKNPIYKAAAKLVGTRAETCDQTAYSAIDNSKVNEGGGQYIRVSLAQARTGDLVPEPGHVAIYTGPGATAIHGDVNTHRTFRANSPLRNAYYADRPYSNIFRYNSP
jgi:hypothetical protein